MGETIVVGVFKMIPKGWEKRVEDLKIRGKNEAIQTTALLRQARILSPWRPEETCCHSVSIERQPANSGGTTHMAAEWRPYKQQHY